MIIDEDVDLIKEEQRALNAKNLTKKLDKSHELEQRLKNIEKILDLIKQKGVTNYNSI